MTKMDKFKLKRIKATKTEKTVVLIMFILISFIYVFYPIKTQDNYVDYFGNVVEKPKNKLEFNGVLQNEIVINSRYKTLLYLKDGHEEEHLVDTFQNLEVNFDELIIDTKREAFFSKEKELLLLKYPRRIVNILLSDASKTYTFKENYLEIVYNCDGLLETSRKFDLKFYYTILKEYIDGEFSNTSNDLPESGFVYDPNKISVSFTFDDGPNGDKTEKLIDALEDYKMSASFFVVGYKIPNQPDTVKKIYNSHSEIGYHSYAHAYFTAQSVSKIKEEFTMANKMLNDITGGNFEITRPPYGSYNNIVLNAIDNAFIYWNLDTNDWRYKDVEYIKSHVLDNLSDGSIILFHDTYDTSIEAAIELLDILYLMDVQVLSVSELANLKNINLQDHQIYFNFK